MKGRVIARFSLGALATVLEDIAVLEGSEVLVIWSALASEYFLAIY